MIELGTFSAMATRRRLQCSAGTGILIGSGDLEMVRSAGTSLPQGLNGQGGNKDSRNQNVSNRLTECVMRYRCRLNT